MFGMSWFQILVVLLIVLLVFGTKRIRHLGRDLGGAIRDFRKGVSEDDEREDESAAEERATTSADSDSESEADADDDDSRPR